MRLLAWLAIFAGSLLAISPAIADELRPGLLTLEQRDASRWDIGWKEPVSGTSDPEIATQRPALPAPCRFDGDPVVRSFNQALIGTGSILCNGPLVGEQIGYPSLAPNAEMLVRIIRLDGTKTGEAQVARLTALGPVTIIAGPSAGPPVWQSYVALGVEHILEGWDHLLFVIALVLLVARWRAVALAVTAFTVAHSLTLAGTTLGLLGLAPRAVEAVIALSIVLLAVELAMRRTDSLTVRYPWAVAFGFGLIHGFGFAGALQEIGLPKGDVAAALLSFNVGVEIGQLLIVAAVLALRWLLIRFAPRADPVAMKLASYGIGITGAYWLVDRLIG